LEAFNILPFLSKQIISRVEFCLTNYIKIKYERIGSRTALTESEGETIAAVEVSYGSNIWLPFNGGIDNSADMRTHV